MFIAERGLKSKGGFKRDKSFLNKKVHTINLGAARLYIFNFIKIF